LRLCHCAQNKAQLIRTYIKQRFNRSEPTVSTGRAQLNPKDLLCPSGSHFTFRSWLWQKDGETAATPDRVHPQIFRINTYVVPGINCSRPVSGSFCEPREVLHLAIEMCHQLKTSSLAGEGRKGKKKKRESFRSND